VRTTHIIGMHWMRQAAGFVALLKLAGDRCRSMLGRAFAARREISRRIMFFSMLALIAAFWGLAIVVMEINAFIVVFSLVACVFILYDFRFGVVLLIVLMPISSSVLFPHEMFGVTGINPINLLLTVTLLSYVLKSAFQRSAGSFIPSRQLVAYIAVVLAAGALGARHVDEIPASVHLLAEVSFDDAGGYVRDVVIKPLFFVLFALLTAAAVRESAKPEKFLVPMLISIWMMGLMVVLYFLASGLHLGDLAGEHARGFLSPLGMHANNLARLYVTAYAILLFTWLHWGGPLMRLFLLASMALVAIALLLTFSRAGFLAFIIVNAIFLWRQRQSILLFFGALAVAAALMVMPGAIGYRLTAGFGQGADAISAGRVDEIWTPLLPEIFHSPLYGQGLSSILWSDAMKAQTILAVDHPHNAYLGALLDTGIIGLIVMLVFYWSVLRGFWKLSVADGLSRLQRAFFGGAAAGLIAFLVVGMSGSKLTPVPEQSILWFAIGMMYGFYRPKTKGQPDQEGITKDGDGSKMSHAVHFGTGAYDRPH